MPGTDVLSSSLTKLPKLLSQDSQKVLFEKRKFIRSSHSEYNPALNSVPSSPRTKLPPLPRRAQSAKELPKKELSVNLEDAERSISPNKVHSVRFADLQQSYGPQMIDIEIQTEYRDSDTQTEPWTPDYVIRDPRYDENGQLIKPEVVVLKELGLGYAKGLPIGKDEMEMIERARQKRDFEATFPPLSDEKSLEQRRKMLQEQENMEWKWREQEIKKVQTDRLEMMKNALKAQEIDRELSSTAKVQSIMDRSLHKSEQQIKKIKKQKVKLLRKQAKALENVEGKLQRRDIIADYANFGSTVYAPRTREGRRREGLILEDIKPPTLTVLTGIQKLENTLPPTTNVTTTEGYTSLQQVMVGRLKPKTATQRQEMILTSQLHKLGESLKVSKQPHGEKLGKPSVAERIEKPPPRPPTPTMFQPDDNESLCHAVILIQRLLRGRAVQNMMFEGRSRRLELIMELKNADHFQDIDHKETSVEKTPFPTKKVEVPNEAPQIDMVDAMLEEMTGTVIGQALDFLSKELVRFTEERRIAGMVHAAEEIRRKRECEEGRKRQQEQLLRQQEDIQFRQIMEVHQRTAATFLEEIIQDAERTIRKRQEIEEMLTKEEEERSLAKLNLRPEQVINELVFDYLFPLVEFQSSKVQSKLEDHKYAKAAHDAVSIITPDIGKALGIQMSFPPYSPLKSTIMLQ